MKFIVKSNETGKIISPRNYYFVLNQNGELYTFGGNGKFERAEGYTYIAVGDCEDLQKAYDELYKKHERLQAKFIKDRRKFAGV